jgi:hypothetical protein
MKSLLRCCLLFACALAGAPAAADDALSPGCSKNHFILDEPLACWQDAGPLHVARQGHTATLLADGRVLVAGGVGDAGTSAEIYDPVKGSWTLAATLHLTRAGHTATLLLDGRVLILGGHQTYIAPVWLPGAMAPTQARVLNDDTGEMYDPAADTWTSIPGPLTPRGYFSATLLADGRVLILGGIDDSDNSLGSAELYDPTTGQWAQTGSLPRGAIHASVQSGTRWGHTATLLGDGRVLMAGGFDDDWTMNGVPEAYLYDPATGLWMQAGRLTDPRAWHTANLLPDGRVIVAGGEWHYCPDNGDWCREHTLGTTEVYDPATRAWSPGPPLGVARSSHTSTLLADGSLFAVGGSLDVRPIPDFKVVTLAGTELYAASASAWTAAPSLPRPRAAHTATRLSDGSVLVVGGGEPKDPPLIYRPPRASTL